MTKKERYVVALDVGSTKTCALIGEMEEEGVELQFETHRNCITNDLFTTLLLLDAIPELRLCADLSHFLLDREFWYPISPENHTLIRRVLERSDPQFVRLLRPSLATQGQALQEQRDPRRRITEYERRFFACKHRRP